MTTPSVSNSSAEFPPFVYYQPHSGLVGTKLFRNGCVTVSSLVSINNSFSEVLNNLIWLRYGTLFINLCGALHMNSSCPALLYLPLCQLLRRGKLAGQQWCSWSHLEAIQQPLDARLQNRLGAFQFQTEAAFNFDMLFPSNNTRAALTDSGMQGFVWSLLSKKPQKNVRDSSEYCGSEVCHYRPAFLIKC